MVASNPYLDFYESIAPQRKRKNQPRIVKSDREAPMVLKGAEKEVAENNALFRRYKRYKAHEYKRLLEGEHGAALQELHTTLKAMTFDGGADPLLELMGKFRWLLGYDRGLRYLVLQMIDDAICRLRVQSGLPVINDALPGEDDTVFQICRSNLTKGDPP
jgi:hypothetical protein